MERKKLVLEIEVEIPEWAKYVTISDEGEVRAWLLKPMSYDKGKRFAPNNYAQEPSTKLIVEPRVLSRLMAVDELPTRSVIPMAEAGASAEREG